MVSTIVDEDRMLQLLNVEPTGANAQELLTGACMVLLDAYDRRLPRPQAEIYIRNTMNLYDLVGRLSAFSNAVTHYSQVGEVSEADLLAAVAGCEKLVKKQTAEIIKLAKLLPECAETGEPIQ